MAENDTPAPTTRPRPMGPVAARRARIEAARAARERAAAVEQAWADYGRRI